jgi:hypothetical protein
MRVGDSVLIARRVSGWVLWVGSMDRCVGKHGTVVSVSFDDYGVDNYYEVAVLGEPTWIYPPSALDLIDIAVGSRVLIARRGAGWVSPMNQLIGKEGIVLRRFIIEHERVFCSVSIPGESTWNYPLESLDLLGDFLAGHGPNNTHLSQELPP